MACPSSRKRACACRDGMRMRMRTPGSSRACTCAYGCQDGKGYTVLMLASEHGQCECTRLLLKAKANAFVERQGESKNKTALSLAANAGCSRVVLELLHAYEALGHLEQIKDAIEERRRIEQYAPVSAPNGDESTAGSSPECDMAAHLQDTYDRLSALTKHTEVSRGLRVQPCARMHALLPIRRYARMHALASQGPPPSSACPLPRRHHLHRRRLSISTRTWRSSTG